MPDHQGRRPEGKHPPYVGPAVGVSLQLLAPLSLGLPKLPAAAVTAVVPSLQCVANVLGTPAIQELRAPQMAACPPFVSLPLSADGTVNRAVTHSNKPCTRTQQPLPPAAARRALQPRRQQPKALRPVGTRDTKPHRLAAGTSSVTQPTT